MRPPPACWLVLPFALVLSFACDKVRATTDRALVTLTLKPACPDAVEGRAVGTDNPDSAVGCFSHAVAEQSSSLLLRVTCGSRSPASCKQTDARAKEVERAMDDLKKTPWTAVLGSWSEGSDSRTRVFAVDTHPGEKRVSTVVVCRIAEGERWAVCELNEVSRDQAEQKMRGP